MNRASTLRFPRTPAVPEEAASPTTESELVVLSGAWAGRRIELHDEMTLGRSLTCTVTMPDEGISRKHCTFRLRAGQWWVEDLGSRNGVYCNGERVAHASVVAVGDKISLGTHTVLLFANRDRFEAQRIQAQKLQALGQLAGGVAHDFNNLLGAVLANTSYLKREGRLAHSPLHQVLGDIETAARRAVDLSRQLLTFARSSRRACEPVSLTELVQDAARLLARTLDSSIRIEVDVGADLWVVGDASQLLQVLMNLCINAGDAMPQGGTVRLEVNHVSLAADHSFALLRVRDTGVGMSQQLQARAFEPFFTTKARGKGTGLGLATVRAIVRDHGGRVCVHSTPGRGCVVELALRCRDHAAPRSCAREQTAVQTTLRHAVLLVDDEPLVRRSRREAGTRAGRGRGD